jgi:hypothetical protein
MPSSRRTLGPSPAPGSLGLRGWAWTARDARVIEPCPGSSRRPLHWIAMIVLPRYYRICLRLSVFECCVAFTIALAQWVNLMPIWIARPDAQQLSDFERYMTAGYGFWGAAWAIPCYLMLGCTDRATLLRWAWLAAGLYALWWVFWWHQIWNGTWQWYVLVGYLPLRAFQLGARPPRRRPDGKAHGRAAAARTGLPARRGGGHRRRRVRCPRQPADGAAAAHLAQHGCRAARGRAVADQPDPAQRPRH